jgi:small conductance mechanosensitive channel
MTAPMEETPWEHIVNKLRSWADIAIDILPNLAVAILVVLVFSILGRIAVRAAKPALNRVSAHKQLHGLALASLKVGILLTGIFIALGVLDLDGTVTSLLAGVGVIGIALGFAFQDIAANFMAGIILAIREPFKEGEVCRIGTFEGTIERLDLRATVGKTYQGQIVHIPNKDVLGTNIVNFHTSGERRIEVEVSVSYGDDLDEAEEAVLEALSKVTERDESKDVEVWLTGFGDSAVTMSARVWILQPDQNFLVTRAQMVKHLRRSLKERGLTIPFPIRTLDFGIVGGKELGEAMERPAA